MGGPPFGVAAVSLHHGAQRRRGHHRAGVELVAGARDHPLAQATEIRPGLRRQGRGGGRTGGARAEQKGHADDGRHFDCHGVVFFDDSMGAIGQQTGVADPALGRSAGGSGILRRLRQNHPAERGRHSAAREVVGADGGEPVHRRVFVGDRPQPAGSSRKSRCRFTNIRWRSMPPGSAS